MISSRVHALCRRCTSFSLAYCRLHVRLYVVQLLRILRRGGDGPQIVHWCHVDLIIIIINKYVIMLLMCADSVVQETCRLSSGVFMVRHVTDDTWFVTSDSQRHLIRQGDRVAIYPPAIHKDPEIFHRPTVWASEHSAASLLIYSGSASDSWLKDRWFDSRPGRYQVN